MADFFIEDLVKTMIDRKLPNIPKMPMVTRIGPYITSLKSSVPCEISSKVISKASMTVYCSMWKIVTMNCVNYNYLLLLGLQKLQSIPFQLQQ